MIVDIISGEHSTFIKIAPLITAIQKEQKKGTSLRYRLIYIGHHYNDKQVNDQFFSQLNIPKPHINLEINAGTPAEETAIIMARYEKVLNANQRPDIVIVTGNTNTAMACAITAKKMKLKVAHLDAGIRVDDIWIPGDVNGTVTDSITDYYFTAAHSSNENLRQQGVAEENIFFVGNTLIDTLNKHNSDLEQPVLWEKLQLEPQNYLLVTLNKPENVANVADLKALLIAIIQSSRGLPVIFPVHPGTIKTLQSIGIRATNLYAIEYLSYLRFQFLARSAKAVLTDSASIQDETTAMQVPCISITHHTNHPETYLNGTNALVGSNPNNISAAFEQLFAGKWPHGHIPYLWDGKATDRIIEVLKNLE